MSDAPKREQKTKLQRVCLDFVIELRANSDKLKDEVEKIHQWIDNG